ncbi:MAG: hypothetical protein M1838_000013 [Thelocarpon superellum]|nr:MAG: hypothetical protein M1838_000013 [Thelocarpon superellum]
MSDTPPKTPTTIATNGKPAMTDADSKFLIECLKNTKGAVTIDLDAVANALDYKNPRSVGNRLALLKKTYGLAITTSASGKDTGKEANKDASPVAGGPIKPDKVVKKRTPRKPAAKKPKKEEDDGDFKVQPVKDVEDKKVPATENVDEPMGDQGHDEVKAGPDDEPMADHKADRGDEALEANAIGA